jgi:hypothetical protein
MIGAAGRIYLAGDIEDVVRARDAIATTLQAIEGRES